MIPDIFIAVKAREFQDNNLGFDKFENYLKYKWFQYNKEISLKMKRI